MSSKLLSVIIPTYNASDSILSALQSLLDSRFCDAFEIIVVDDCSKDNSFELVQDLAKTHANIVSLRLDKNSGSPSMPRNKGIEQATGKYLFFLDDDDLAEPERLYKAVLHAEKNDLDFLKGYLKVVKNNGIFEANRIQPNREKKDSIVTSLIANTSTNMFILLKREFAMKHSIRFDPKFKIGEDTLITCQIFSCNPKADYIDDYFVFYNKKADVNNLSSTQNYGDKELNDHIEVWALSEQALNKVNLSYYKLRLAIAVKNTITSIVSFSRGKISKEMFLKLSGFVNAQKRYIKGSINLHQRFQEVLDAILSGDYQKFQDVTKRRLLINGFDLKFIQPVVKYLETDYNIIIDEWTSHNARDHQKCTQYIAWADIIFCEWMMGNAAWYSKNKMSFQTLLIRAHRFEITREFGYEVKMDQVDAVITVSYYYLEKFAQQFDIPKGKMQLLSNYVEEEIYTGEKKPDSAFNICLAGILPARKGYLKGLELLKELRETDPRFQLVILGSDSNSVDWISKNPMEKDYFDTCENFIDKNDLRGHVHFSGWLERSEMFNNVSYVLSLSDPYIPESFHLAPAEALADHTAALILAWPGVEYIYPDSMIFQSVHEIKEMIMNLSQDKQRYDAFTAQHRSYILENYAMETFIDQLKRILEKTVLSK